MNDQKRSNSIFRWLLGEGKISSRFRNINITLFASAIFFLTLAVLAVFNSIIQQLSSTSARRYAASSAESLATHIVKEISLMSAASRLEAVIDWLADEHSTEKKNRAFNDLSNIVNELYSSNMYIGVEKSLNEYVVDNGFNPNHIIQVSSLKQSNPEDSWYFECISSDYDYTLNIGVDKVMNRKRVWLNYKVLVDGATLGVICTGLDFGHLADELFSHYDKANLRSLIIDEKGYINMDSALLGSNEYLLYEAETHIEDEFSDPALLNSVRGTLSSVNGYYDEHSEPDVIKLSSSPYSYTTIAPIRQTNWSVIIFFDSSLFLDIMAFLPLFAVMLILLITFALVTNTVIYRLIFKPLEQLIRSLALLKEGKGDYIYGVDRIDEFGTLSNTIQDLFTKANYDALTGIYNRRFLENNLQRIMEMLSRSNGTLSMLMVDVDFFKKYNDTYGHEQGDECLKAIALAISQTITRTNDFAARYGGEEFVVILPNTDKNGAIIISDKLINNVRKLRIPHAESSAEKYVTVSVGATTGTVLYTQSWEDYLKRADGALYMSKQNSRNKYTHLDFNETGTRNECTHLDCKEQQCNTTNTANTIVANTANTSQYS